MMGKVEREGGRAVGCWACCTSCLVALPDVWVARLFDPGGVRPCILGSAWARVLRAEIGTD